MSSAADDYIQSHHPCKNLSAKPMNTLTLDIYHHTCAILWLNQAAQCLTKRQTLLGETGSNRYTGEKRDGLSWGKKYTGITSLQRRLLRGLIDLK